MVRREQFVTTRQFLESARSLDITTIECFYELFDNAFDADATSIRAHIEKKALPFTPILACLRDGKGASQHWCTIAVPEYLRVPHRNDQAAGRST